MNNALVTMFIALAFLSGYTLVNVYAQNGTDTDDGSLGAQVGITMTSVVAIIIAVLGILKSLADRGILDKRVGTAAVIGADTAVAVLDTRKTVQDAVNAIVDTIKVDNPELAAKIDATVRPVLQQVDQKVQEYQPKVDTFAKIANNIGQQGEKTVDAIKENEELKDEIPDKIVPS